MSKSLSARTNEETNEEVETDDPEDTTSMAAKLIEQLRSNASSPHEKKLITASLLGAAESRKEARVLIASHGQAMALFVSILRSGTLATKINVISTLRAICEEEELRVKVLLGGCIPPLLLLLKSESLEARKAAAEALCKVSSGKLSEDPVGMKIFVAEGVIPTLWEQLNDKSVEGFVAGTLRNLCGDKYAYWWTILDASGVRAIVNLLFSDNPVAQSNAASLLVRLMMSFADSIPKIVDSGAVEALIGLLEREEDVCVRVRATAAEALDVVSSNSERAKQVIIDAGGNVILIGAIVSPYKQGMDEDEDEEWGLALQEHAMKALAHVCGGMIELVVYLGELSQSPRLTVSVGDIIGALAYTLEVFKWSEDEKLFESKKVENILVTLLKPRDNKPFQECLLEALSSLYGNPYLSGGGLINQSRAKQVVIGLITMATTDDVQEYLISSLIQLYTEGVSAWEALGKREGISILVSALDLSSEESQEYAVEMLDILIEQAEDSRWAITAAGGIPPLVNLIQVGSEKARLDSTHILWNLCCHSEDIRACVESSGAISAFLCLLKNGKPKGQEAAAVALMKLIRTADSTTVTQLLLLLTDDSPSSKAHVIRVLGHVLFLASHSDLVLEGGFANVGLRSLVQVLDSSNEDTQEYACATAVLADLFCNRKDICDSLATDEVINPCMKHLTSKTQGIVTRLNKAKTPFTGEVHTLIESVKTRPIASAEIAMDALASLLSDPQVAAEALAADVVSAITKVMKEGTLKGKKIASRALHHLLKHFPLNEVVTDNSQCQFVILGVVDSLNVMDMDSSEAADALESVSMLSQTSQNLNEPQSRLRPLVRFLCEGPASVQDKVIGILCRVSRDQLGDLLVSNPGSVGALASRITKSGKLQARVGGTLLLICAAKEHRSESMDELEASGYMKMLTSALVNMIEVRNGSEFDVLDPAFVLGNTVSLWLLSIVCSYHPTNIISVIEAGGIEALYNNLARHAGKDLVGFKEEFEDTEGIWISTLLTAVLFQDANIASSPMAIRFVQPLAAILNAGGIANKFFAAQAMASLVCHGNEGINLALANSGAVVGLTSLIGHLDMPDLLALSDEFCLLRNPDQVVLESLFEIDDFQTGCLARKTIPSLVDLLRPMPDRPGAPLVSIRLLTKIADGNGTNKLLMAEAGALDALTKYLSLSPHDLSEETISELLRILFSNPDLIRYEAATNCMIQLIAVLRLGSRKARLSAARALEELFDDISIRNSESSSKAIQPLVDMLNSNFESEQVAALSALINLTSGSSLNVGILVEAEGNPLRTLYKIISSATSSSSSELKTDATDLCCVVFCNCTASETSISFEFIDLMILLMMSEQETVVESSVCAFERLLDDDHLLEIITSDHDFLRMLVGLVSGSNHCIIAASISALIKLVKDRTPRKLDMVDAGIIDRCLDLLPTAPSSVCSMIAELFRVLTNSSAVSKTPSACKIVEPLFKVLVKTDIGVWGQHSTLQSLVNILEKHQSLSDLKVSPSQFIKPLITFLEHPSQAIQQLCTELLSHLLSQEHFKRDRSAKRAILPLVHLAGVGILGLQHTAIKALEEVSLIFPKAIFEAGGVIELSKVIVQKQPLPPKPLLESAALVLSNIVQYDPKYYLNIPVPALVKMLRSSTDNAVKVAVNALLVQEKAKVSTPEKLAEAGVISSLLDLLRSHKCEEASARLLEALFHNQRVREMKASKHAISRLPQYLLDPLTRSQTSKFVVALALGDLSQNEWLARASDSASACRALVSLLEDQPTEGMIMVTICALQNFVVRSRTNRRAVAEAGGVVVIQELLLCSNNEVAAQVAILIKLLFSTHTLQEYVSNEVVISLTAALGREACSGSSLTEEVLRAINVIFSNFHKLHVSEAVTQCIPRLVNSLKSESEICQELTLSTLCLLKHSWETMPLEVSKAQAVFAAEAIPTLQMLMKSCPPNFHDRLEGLLVCLPGCLTVTIGRANNLKHVLGGTYPFCCLNIGNCPPRFTKVVARSTSPEWNQGFTWDFDVPPKGQLLQIECRSKGTFGKTPLGKVMIQIDKVVTEGAHRGVFSLIQDSNKDSSSRTLDIDIAWSNRRE